MICARRLEGLLARPLKLSEHLIVHCTSLQRIDTYQHRLSQHRHPSKFGVYVHVALLVHGLKNMIPFGFQSGCTGFIVIGRSHEMSWIY